MVTLRRHTGSPARAILRALALAAGLAPAAPARAADGLWDAVLEKLDIKASPAARAPDFVERSRPDPDSTGYMPTASPHKVSPVAVKTPDQVQAAKDALDAAKARQLDPRAPRALQAARGKKPKGSALPAAD